MTDNVTSTTSGQAALIGVALAAIVTLFVAPGNWGWLTTIVGLTLLLILWAYDDVGDQEKWREHLAFSAVYGLCLLIALAMVFEGVTSQVFGFLEVPEASNPLVPEADLLCVNERYFDEGIQDFRDGFLCREEGFYQPFDPGDNLTFWVIWPIGAGLVLFMRRRRLRSGRSRRRLRKGN